MRYRLRTLLMLLAIVPPLAWLAWTKYEAWRAEQAARERQRAVIRLWLVLDGSSMPPPAELRKNGSVGPPGLEPGTKGL